MESIAVTPDQFDEILDLTAFAGSIAYSKQGCRAYFVEIGPEMARKILETYNTQYRKMRPRHMESIARDMRAGNWQLDGSPIRLNEDNELADGSHRLTAVVKTEISQEFLVVDRLPVSTYDVMDTNALTRNYIDILRRRGYTQQPNRAALTKMIYAWDNKTSLDFKQSLSIAEMDSIHENPDYRERITWAVHNANSLDRRIPAKKTIIGLALFVLGEIDPTSIKELLLAVSTKENLKRGTPEFTLMTRLENDANSDKNLIRTNDETAYLFFRAWKTYYQNTMRHDSDQIKLEALQYPRNGITVKSLKEMLVMDA
jgi:hypothetical protein